MKSVLTLFKKLQAFSFLVGMFLGASVSLVLFSFLVPNGFAMIGKYNHWKAARHDLKNNHAMMGIYEREYATSTMMRKGMLEHTMKEGDNPYMMGKITSEKQFLRDMIMHHEAAVVMAEEVLEVASTRKEVKDLANTIISTQSEEIQKMKNWLSQ